MATATTAPSRRPDRVTPRTGRLRGMRCLAPLASILVACCAWAADPKPNSDASCLDCHSDNTLTMERDGKAVSLFVEGQVVGKSAHKSLACIDCHEGFDDQSTPHKKPMTRVDCASCHEDTAKTHVFHVRLGRDPVPAARDTNCVGCHGGHDAVPVDSPKFKFGRAVQASGCGSCHQKAESAFVASAHGRVFKPNDKNTPTCLTCHEKPVAHARGELRNREQKLAEIKLCESCHVNNDGVAGQALRGQHFVASFDQSVHGAALKAGKAEAANCVDCHGAHTMDRAFVSGTRMNKQLQPQTCGKCHEEIAAEFDGSVHAAALRKGNFDSPACTDCHGEHEIRGPKDPSSPVNARNVAQQVCATCHASLRLSQKYGLASHAFQTFADSYHGLAVRGGGVEVVNCASCHSSHGIKSHLDPTSTVHKSNLIQTCGQCHPGANTRFTVGSVHVSAEAPDGKAGNNPILHIIATVYVLLIGVVVGGMFVHNALDLVKKIRRKLAIQRGDIIEHPVEHRLYLRMTVHERCQHAALVISFFLLVVTGFMLRYPEAWWVIGIRNLSHHAFEWRSLIHRVAGVTLIAAGLWHTWYLAFTLPGRALFRDLLPRWRDVTDPWKVLRYNLGLAKDKPEFPRFCYIEKAEYWALVWGTLLMGVTGAILWFENTSMGLMTKLGYDISRTIHFYEAVLATLAIVVWHFYFVIFNPDVYPMNLSWLTGRMSEKEMEEEHPLELKRLKELEAKNQKPQPPAAP
ncbi:cytochrome B [Opitutaceae bacterium EW11]|nr:cytochrome B [Opitutaceae bacterium EW11]